MKFRINPSLLNCSIKSLDESTVSILKENIYTYPNPPGNPPEPCPELKSLPYKIEYDTENRVYDVVRKLFSMHNLDHANYGTEKWNPLSGIVSKGDTVVIKPNLVREIFSAVTHSSLLRPIMDYTLIALQGKGKIVICDAPLQSAYYVKKIQNLERKKSKFAILCNGKCRGSA